MAEGLQRVCVIGLGYVGLPTAVILAHNGVEVIGVDIDTERVTAINAGEAPIVEPDLAEMLRVAVTAGKLQARDQPQAADAFIITVPTPFKEDHEPDLRFLEAAADSLAPVLGVGNLVIVESTSPVGTTEMLCARLGAARADLTFPDTAGEASDVRVAYSPERVLPGRILVELVANDRVVGGMTPACANAATSLYQIFLEGKCDLTDARTAELVKLTENAYRDLNIAFANELSLVCDTLEIDPWKTIELANQHPRVDILQPGPGVGGHCIAVDPWFIVKSAPIATPLIETARQVNDAKPAWVAGQALSAAAGEAAIACLGLAYKADIDDLRESASISVVVQLQQSFDGRILVVEPHISTLPPELAKHTGTELVDLETALRDAGVVVLLTDHRVFRELERDRLTGKSIIDTRGIWRRK